MKPELLFGIHSVQEALAAGRRQILELILARGTKPSPRLSEIADLAASAGIMITETVPERMETLCQSHHHQNVALRVQPLPLADLADIRPDRDAFYLVVDSVTDPQNLGALIRTALCVGVRGVILPRDRACAPTPAVSRASAGALEHMTVHQVINLVAALMHLKEEGVWVTGLSMDGASAIFDIDFSGPVALVIGSEDRGIRPLVRTHCDHLAAIPQVGPLNSLNASVAGGVAMYEVFRQRRGAASGKE